MAKKDKVNQITKVSIITAYVLMILISVINIYRFVNSNQPYQVLASDIEDSSEVDADYFYAFTNDYPSYMPGWLRLAEIYIYENNHTAAVNALDVARALDPNSEELLLIQKQLANK